MVVKATWFVNLKNIRSYLFLCCYKIHLNFIIFVDLGQINCHQSVRFTIRTSKIQNTSKFYSFWMYRIYKFSRSSYWRKAHSQFFIRFSYQTHYKLARTLSKSTVMKISFEIWKWTLEHGAHIHNFSNIRNFVVKSFIPSY